MSGRTALHTDEQKFDLMYEQLNDLKNGKSVMKPIYNHVNGTLDTPEEIKPTPIVIIEGLHPFVDERVRDLLDFTIYLDISDEIKFAWKIQRDMMERGHSLESIQASIEVREVACFFSCTQRGKSTLLFSCIAEVLSMQGCEQPVEITSVESLVLFGVVWK